MSIPHEFSVNQYARIKGVERAAAYADLKAGRVTPISWSRSPLKISRQEVERLIGRRLTSADVIKAMVSRKLYRKVFEEKR